MPERAKKLGIQGIATHLESTLGLTPLQARQVTRAGIQGIIEVLQAGHPFDLPDLGILLVRHTNARTGLSPATGKYITLPAGRNVVFRAADADAALPGHVRDHAPV